jgi:hypothetical protein
MAMTVNHNAMIGPKALPIRVVPSGWIAKRRNQDHHRSRQDVWVESRRDDVEPFERRKDRDRWRDGAVAIDQRSPEQPYRHDYGPVPPLDPEKRHQCQNPTLAVIVDPHCERYVLDRRNDDEGPDHKG